MTTTNDTAGKRTRIPALIQEAIDRGESSRSIATRAAQSGHEISHSYVHQLQRGLVTKIPKPETLAALAAGLGLPFEHVRRLAFLDWFEYDPNPDAPMTAAGFSPAIPADLTADERAELDRMIQAWLAVRRAGNGN